MDSLLGALEATPAATVTPSDGRPANSSLREAPQEVLTSVAPRQRPKAGVKAAAGGPIPAPVLPLPPQGRWRQGDVFRLFNHRQKWQHASSGAHWLGLHLTSQRP